MKRFFGLLMTLALVMALPLTALGASLEEPGSASGTIYASLGEEETVINHKYTVDVGWENTGSLVYSKTTKTYTWNSNNLEYDVEVDVIPRWIISEDAAVKITVTNRSDQPVNVYCAAPVLLPDTGVHTLSGHYGTEQGQAEYTFGMPSAANGLEEAGQPQQSVVTYSITGIEGDLLEGVTDIATITVTISALTNSEP